MKGDTGRTTNEGGCTKRKDRRATIKEGGVRSDEKRAKGSERQATIEEKPKLRDDRRAMDEDCKRRGASLEGGKASNERLSRNNEGRTKPKRGRRDEGKAKGFQRNQ